MLRRTMMTTRPAIAIAKETSSFVVGRWFSSNHSNKHDHGHDSKPGSKAFDDCEFRAVADLFYQHAQSDVAAGSTGGVCSETGRSYINAHGARRLLESIGERPDERALREMFRDVDYDGDGRLFLNEFLDGADRALGGAPARVVLVVGGPGSGKGILCRRLERECDNVHLSSGDMLRDEVARDTPLGRECREIMARGDLVPSKIITALVRRHTRRHPNRRILLDGFPRSRENAEDFLRLCGRPELALHLDCDDTVLIERIMKRAAEMHSNREDDTLATALHRLRTFHKYHHQTIEWLREQHVPIVNLDCSQCPENVWNQLMAVGRLMRPAVAYRDQDMRDNTHDTSVFEPAPADSRTA